MAAKDFIFRARGSKAGVRLPTRRCYGEVWREWFLSIGRATSIKDICGDHTGFLVTIFGTYVRRLALIGFPDKLCDVCMHTNTWCENDLFDMHTYVWYLVKYSGTIPTYEVTISPKSTPQMRQPWTRRQSATDWIHSLEEISRSETSVLSLFVGAPRFWQSPTLPLQSWRPEL